MAQTKKLKCGVLKKMPTAGVTLIVMMLVTASVLQMKIKIDIFGKDSEETICFVSLVLLIS